MKSRWSGGASVRRRSGGTLNVPKPLAALTVMPGQITLHVRPRLLSARLPGRPWQLTPLDRTAIFPVRGSAFQRGVGFERASDKPIYFWCGRALPDVLTAIDAAGFVVVMEERRPEWR